MPQPTKTINRLHFSDLDPLRFEDLCLNLVYRINTWKEINHFGRKGSDDGVDVFAIEKENQKKWSIQCKRYALISKSDIKGIVDKIIQSKCIPDRLLVVVSCDVTKSVYQYLKDYSIENGIEDSELWTASVLEAKLYNEYKDLLFVYFGIQIGEKQSSNAAKIKASLRMEKRVSKELLDHKFIKECRGSKTLLYNPAAKFISSAVYIRSIDDNTYPNCEETPRGQISPWFKTYFYDTYHNGIELWLDAGIGTYVIMDNEGFWEPLSDYCDIRKKDSKYQVILAKVIGRIPYYNIIDFKIDGDEYTSDPHLFCKFSINGMPYEEIYYKSHGNPQKEILDWEFDKAKRTKFPK